MQKSFAVLPEVVIGNPFSLKNKTKVDSRCLMHLLLGFAGMTEMSRSQDFFKTLNGGDKMVNKDALQDKLKQLRDAVKQRWGVLTDKDLATVDGKLDQLPALLQKKYGYTREQAGKEIKLFLSDMKAKGENVFDVVLDTLTDETPQEKDPVK